MTTLQEPSGTSARTRCPLCGEVISPVHPGECPRCDWVEGYRHRTTGGDAHDATAALLSVLPGLGHLYKGHKTGYAYLVGTVLAVLLSGLAATPTMGMGLILLPLYWAWVITMAYWIEDRRAAPR